MILQPQSDGLWHATINLNGRTILVEGNTQDEAWRGALDAMDESFNELVAGMRHTVTIKEAEA